MSKAMLIDTTRCIGCRACQVACKSWHDLPGEPTTFSETLSNPRYINSNTYTRIIFREIAGPEAKFSWYFIKRQCDGSSRAFKKLLCSCESGISRPPQQAAKACCCDHGCRS